MGIGHSPRECSPLHHGEVPTHAGVILSDCGMIVYAIRDKNTNYSSPRLTYNKSNMNEEKLIKQKLYIHWRRKLGGGEGGMCPPTFFIIIKCNKLI